MYDFLIVGSGLFGAVFASEMKKLGKRCIVLEKRKHAGGNIFTEKIEDINVHKYGAHIFHTSDKSIWDYVNSIVEFRSFVNSPAANYKGEIYSLPFNMWTFSKLWNIRTPEEALKIINDQKIKIDNPENFEEWALSQVGYDIYNKLIYGYTYKQWGRDPKELPCFIIKRLPLRFKYDNNYFDDDYQGIPVNGYTLLIEKLLEGTEIKTDVDFFDSKPHWESVSNKILYTGKIDEFFAYCYGELEYRSLEFRNEILDMENYQGVAVMNFTDLETPYTRIIEHKHFENGKQKNTVITKEYPAGCGKNKEPYYPVNNTANNNLFERYNQKARQCGKYLFGGRLASYKYYDMHQIIGAALKLSKEISKAEQDRNE